jgi:hypothetical protein
MGQVSPYLRRTQAGYAHYCPGCESLHVITTEPQRPGGPVWSFDGNLTAPTFGPSVNCTWGRFADPNFVEESPDESGRCHYFLTAGQLQFLGDCTHALAGQTVPLPVLPPGYTDD